MIVELVAPTGGHSFELARAETKGARTDLYFVHRGPGDRMVTQVITTLPVTVPAERIGAARAVFVWVAKDRDAAGTAQLAIATSRP